LFRPDESLALLPVLVSNLSVHRSAFSFSKLRASTGQKSHKAELGKSLHVTLHRPVTRASLR
jgi:hypothetical protein